MQFLDLLTNYLDNNNLIYTVRKYEMGHRLVEVSGVGTCERKPLGKVYSKEDLEPYYRQSGFGTLEDWWEKVKHFIPTNGPYYLYRVTKWKGEKYV